VLFHRANDANDRGGLGRAEHRAVTKPAPDRAPIRPISSGEVFIDHADLWFTRIVEHAAFAKRNAHRIPVVAYHAIPVVSAPGAAVVLGGAFNGDGPADGAFTKGHGGAEGDRRHAWLLLSRQR
jgi:hypothetical protein